MPSFSIIVPLFNRPTELRELLLSLSIQTYQDFEVIVVEDGSEITGEEVCSEFENKLHLHYYFKSNEGPGLTRNFGCQKASSDYFIFFDSDCVIPKGYMRALSDSLKETKCDAFGGPDAADSSFTNIQKAINYSMTSLFTTGGIRGSKKTLEKFHPRSFNMGMSRIVFEKTGGFSNMRFGEDVDLSIRIIKYGFNTSLISECFVYHKRRTDLKKFYKQVYNSGIARINLHKRHPGSLKLVHFFPSFITIYSFAAIIWVFGMLAFSWKMAIVPFIPLALYYGAIFIDSLVKYKSIWIAALAKQASFVQLTGYGLGFLHGIFKRLILRQNEFEAFENSF